MDDMPQPSPADAPAAPAPAPEPSRAPRRGRWLLLALLVALVIGAGLIARSGLWRPFSPPADDDPFPLLAISDSPYLNTRPEVGYVGAEACRGCHEDRHRSFRHTGMGRSMATVDLGREPADATYDHPVSKRRYQVRRKGGQLWHRELLLTEGPEEVLLAEYPMKYVIGSGRHTLTYAAEAEGFLVESPVTWYRSRNAWGMSPGYDSAHQAGFERSVGEGCLVCHAGQFEAREGSVNRMVVGEPAIGCERCHGPGALHVEKQAGRKPSGGRRGAEVDHTIVNPSRLSRELGEAICQQCHLRANATIPSRGRRPTEFRPGLPLQDFRQDYRLDGSDSSMTVTGHVEQMHLSRCYQKSETLTCLTCHDPHDEATMTSASTPAVDAKRLAHYRAVCLTCHEAQHCKVDPGVRKKERPDNYCVHCHMPTSPTDIPHLAFTHHRIGRHGRKGEEKPAGAGAEGAVLRPFLALPRLSDIDQRRSLGLGYLEAAGRAKVAAESSRFQSQGLELLLGVKKEGLRDPVVDASLTRVFAATGEAGVTHLAESALAQKQGLGGNFHGDTLYLLATYRLREGRQEEARSALRQLVGLRRRSMDWLLLAQVESSMGRIGAEEEALVQATRINPRLWQVHQHLADRYRKRGDKERSAWHQKRAVP